MSREKQIEEMAKIACVGSCEGDCENCKSVGICSSYTISEKLYNAGYRKQEWISVEERLPDEYGDYLVTVKANKLWETEWEHGVSAACYVISEIPNVNGWHIEIEDGYQYEITHWMPLPEAPKGGAG